MMIERCWFSFEPKKTLLNYLLSRFYSPKEFIEAIETFDTVLEEQKYLQQHPEDCKEEDLETVEEMISDYQNMLTDCLDEYEMGTVDEFKSEIKTVLEWVKNIEKLLGNDVASVMDYEAIDIDAIYHELQNDSELSCGFVL